MSDRILFVHDPQRIIDKARAYNRRLLFVLWALAGAMVLLSGWLGYLGALDLAKTYATHSEVTR